MRGGGLNDPRFGSRMRGSGPRWESLEQLFELACRKHGLNRTPHFAPTRRREQQGELFGA